MPASLARIWDVAGRDRRHARAGLHRRARARDRALTLLFVGSAVVVLERFARQVRRLRSVAIAAAALLAALVARGLRRSSRRRRRERCLGYARGGVALVRSRRALGRARARVVPPRPRARERARLGLGYALVVGGSRARLRAAPAVVALARRRSSLAPPARRPRRRAERLAGRSALVLALGALLPLAPPGADAARLGGRRVALSAVFGVSCCSASLPLARAGFLDLRGSAEWFIAARYLVAKRRQTFISVITGDLRGRRRGGRVADHHGALGDERLRAHLARRDHRQPRALHGAQRPRRLRRLPRACSSACSRSPA